MEYNFRFSLTEDDFADFNACTLWLAPWNKKKRIKFFIKSFVYNVIFLTGIIYLIDEIVSSKQKNNLNFKIALSLSFALISAWYNYYHASLRVKKSAKQKLQNDENKNFLNENELKISETGIFGANKMGTVNYVWISIVKYAVTKIFFYLYMNSIEAIIISKRLFKSEEEINEFDKFLTEKVPLSSSFRSIGI
jgi:YcxB-like protein